MKQFLILILALLFCTNNIQAQKKGILLSNKKYEETEFFKENKRVKITTTDGKVHKGRIVIVDEKTISIQNELIPIDFITKIQSNSLFSKIVATTNIVIGSAVIILGIASGGYGILLLPPGALILGVGILIPITGSNHNTKKWDYKIETNYIIE
jgi:hypothetical protein